MPQACKVGTLLILFSTQAGSLGQAVPADDQAGLRAGAHGQEPAGAGGQGDRKAARTGQRGDLRAKAEYCKIIIETVTRSRSLKIIMISWEKITDLAILRTQGVLLGHREEEVGQGAGHEHQEGPQGRHSELSQDEFIWVVIQ